MQEVEMHLENKYLNARWTSTTRTQFFFLLLLHTSFEQEIRYRNEFFFFFGHWRHKGHDTHTRGVYIFPLHEIIAHVPLSQPPNVYILHRTCYEWFMYGKICAKNWTKRKNSRKEKKNFYICVFRKNSWDHGTRCWGGIVPFIFGARHTPFVK